MAATVIPSATASSFAAAPANDNFSDASVLAAPDTSTPTSISGTNTDATGESGEPNPAQAARVSGCADAAGTASGGYPCQPSVWYTLAPTQTGPVALQTCELSGGGDTVLGVYTGSSVDALTEVASDDDQGQNGTCSPTVASRVNFIAQAGTTYHVLVGGFEGNETDFTLHATQTVDPPEIDSSFGDSVNPDTEDQTFFVNALAGSTLQCSLDGAAAEPCSSQFSYAPDRFADGTSHTLTATASADGFTSDPSEEFDWTIDETVPTVSITDGPADGDSTAVPFDFTLRSDEDADLHCYVDGLEAYYDTCGGRISAGSDVVSSVPDTLCDASHTFGFAVEDEAGNATAPPVTRNVTTSGGSGACQQATVGTPSTYTLQPTYAGLRGNIDPHGTPSSYHVEWGTSLAYGHTTGEQSIGFSPTSASQGVEFLDPSTTYHARYVVHNSQGTVISDDVEFTTVAASGNAPTASLGTPTEITGSSARLNATLTSDQDSSAEFEYGTTTTYGSSTEVQNGPRQGSAPRSAHVRGLQPGTTYHYRALVENSGGTFRTADATFRTSGGSGSPAGPGSSPPIIPSGPREPVKHGAPVLKAASAAAAHLTGTGKLAFNVYSSEGADGTATGTVSVPGAAKVYRFAAKTVHLAGGTKTKVTLKLKKKYAKRISRALAHKRRLKAKVVVLVHDRSGNKSSKTITLKLKR
jgi:hypothetical protein